MVAREGRARMEAQIATARAAQTACSSISCKPASNSQSAHAATETRQHGKSKNQFEGVTTQKKSSTNRKWTRVVATQIFHAGSVILRENPLLLLPRNLLASERLDSFDRFSQKYDIDHRLLYLTQLFFSSDQHTQKCVLKLQYPYAQDSKLSKLIFETPDMKLPLDDLEVPAHWDLELLPSVMLILSARAIDTEAGLAVYELCSTLSHSCLPNARASSDAQGFLSVVAHREIQEGEEILVSFLTDSELVMSTNARQTRLLSSKNFYCSCPACQVEVDDRREFNCLVGDCNGVIRIRQRLPNDTCVYWQLENSPVPLACEECGSPITRETKGALAKVEVLLAKDWASLNAIHVNFRIVVMPFIFRLHSIDSLYGVDLIMYTPLPHDIGSTARPSNQSGNHKTSGEHSEGWEGGGL